MTQPPRPPTRTSDFVLPSELAKVRDKLWKATQQHDDDPAIGWPEGEKLLKAHAPERIADLLIPIYHSHLRPRTIHFLWVEDASRNNKTVLGKANVAGGKVKYFSEGDFIIEFNFVHWGLLLPAQRVALVDHELCHCTVAGQNEKPAILAHDVEEFGCIIHRWGLWKPDLERFGETMKHALQLEMFGDRG